jgi:DNA-binding transcriptional MerR regulator
MPDRALRPVPEPDRPDGRMTIDELARAAGMTVRNIRNHQSRGLLPPPEVVARIGYYGQEHLERLQLIREMQADGFNLEAIRRLLAGGDERFVKLRRAVTAPLEAETPEIITAEELAERFGPPDERTLAKAAELDVLVPLGDGRYEVPAPSLLHAAARAVEQGVDLQDALEAVERAKRGCEQIARAFVRLFLKELWEPVRGAPGSDERWPQVVDAIGALRPVASQTVLALFTQAMAEEMEHAFAREVERISRSRRR